MTSASYRVRRALIDDLPALRELWRSMNFSVDDLEKQLLEFQVAETADGALVGALGIRIARQHACLHSEGYTDFSVADAVRELFWQRAQVLAANHGVFRLWTQERSPFWTRWGFQPASGEILNRLPTEWKAAEGQWLTLQLKDEDAINAVLEKEFTVFKTLEDQQTTRTLEQAKTFKLIFTAIAFAIGIVCFGVAIYLLLQRLPHGSTP